VPTDKQVLGARIRAAEEAYVKKHRKPYKGGGWIIPSRQEVHGHLSAMFDIPVRDIGFFLTYSRNCTHTWAQGACDACPD
jgi:hypothetical protein